MSDVAIRVESLGKRYHVGRRKRSNSLRESLAHAVTAPWRRLLRLDKEGGNGADTFWALEDVSFEVRRGEVVGIVGRNGAGKSTLLKVLSRITEPSAGEVAITGRVGSLLEVGTGFHPELTGRENVFLNGAILGMARAEIARKFDEIVAFSEVERFIDTPVKHYSSGMYVRLAFAVAAHLEPEILIVDEVLAVGDAAFQKKCLGKMGDVSRAGRTVLFVSHNLGAVRGLCSRGLWFDSGRLARDGDVQTAITRYMDSIAECGFESIGKAGAGDRLQITSVVLKNSAGQPTTQLHAGEALTVEIRYRATTRLERPRFWVNLKSQFGPLCGANMLLDNHCPEAVEGEGTLACTFRALPLLPQSYTVYMGVRDQTCVGILASTREIGCFNVVGRMRDYGFEGEIADTDAWDTAPVVFPYSWHLPNGSIKSVDGIDRKGRSS
jgi:lipopolysaccharide transport system ATP-binding protein